MHILTSYSNKSHPKTPTEIAPGVGTCFMLPLNTQPQRMVLYVDERVRGHMYTATHQAIQALGYDIAYTKLEIGDFMLFNATDAGKLLPGLSEMPRSVRLERNLHELATHICSETDEALRFRTELKRAEQVGMMLLVVATEHGIRGPEDIVKLMSGEYCMLGCDCCARKQNGLRSRTDFWNPAPLSGEMLLQTIESCCNDYVTVHFVDDDVRAAEVISAWLEGRW